jgi:hypothetical protein
MYVDKFIGKPIDDLNGFNIVSLHSSQINEIRKGATDAPAYKDSIDQEHWKYISSIKEVRLQLYINWILTLTFSIERPQFYLRQRIEDNNLIWSLDSLQVPHTCPLKPKPSVIASLHPLTLGLLHVLLTLRRGMGRTRNDGTDRRERP